HLVRRLSTVTDINRSVVGIILSRRTVTPCRVPVAVVPVVVTATDQLHTIVMRVIPALIVPFRMIRAKYFVLRTLPVFGSLNPIILVVGNRRNLLRLRLRTEVRVLRFDLLHLLRVRLLRLAPSVSLRVLLTACQTWRSCTGRRSRTSSCVRPRRLLHTLLPLLNLLLAAMRRHSSGNIRSRRVSISRFLVRPTLAAFSSTRLIRRAAGRLTGNIRFWGGRRFVARMSSSALFRTGLGHSSGLI